MAQGVFVSAGSYSRETDNALYIPQISSTIVGLIGGATNGPINERVFISNSNQFVNTFGAPSLNSQLGYAALQYLNKGNQLFVVRVASNAAAQSVASVPGLAAAGFVDGVNSEPYTIFGATPAEITGTQLENFIITLGTNDAFTIEVDGGGDQIVTIPAGTYTATTLATTLNGLTTDVNFTNDGGYLKVESVSTGTAATIEIKAVANSVYATIGYSVGLVTGTDGNNTLVVSVDGGGNQTITLTPGASVTAATVASEIDAQITGAISYVPSGSDVVRIQSSTTGLTSSIQVIASSTADTLLGLDNVLHVGSGNGAMTMEVKSKFKGTSMNGIIIRMIPATSGIAGEFHMLVIDNSTGNEIVLENWDNLSKNPVDANYVETVVNDARTGSTRVVVDDNTLNLSVPSTVSGSNEATMAGGNDGLAGLTDADYIGVITPSVTGLQLFSNPEEVDINILAVPGISSVPVIEAGIQICENRADSIYIADPPFGLSAQEVMDWHNGTGAYLSLHDAINSSYAAIYWPWFKLYDPYNRQEVFVAPSCAALPVYSYTDSNAEPWFAPAGLNRGKIPNAIAVETQVDQGSRDLIYSPGQAINPIVNFVGEGIVIWGQKTTQRKPTPFDRVNVRRLFLIVRKVIARVGKYLVFEPNDSDTWDRYKSIVRPYLDSILRRRGIERFEVIMDETNNSAADRNNNRLNGKILIEPTQTTEILVSDFTVVPAGASFQEYTL